MLKSTYKGQELPPGWTQHKAPSGHIYYYNAETKKSTYKRPVAPPEPPQPIPVPQVQPPAFAPYPGATPFYPGPGVPAAGFPPAYPGYAGFPPFAGPQFPGFQQPQQQRRRHDDRPKHKYPIPGHEDWFLIKTKLRRRFVYNSKTDESFWKIPEDVLEAVKEFDRREREKKEKKEKGEEAPAPKEEKEDETKQPTEGPQDTGKVIHPEPGAEDSSEYEEVEVTEEELSDEELQSKRARTEEGAAPDNNAPVEFNEEDIAYQLEAMGEAYGLDPGEYGTGMQDEEDWQEGEEGLPLTEEDSAALFRDLLDDFAINPYSPWEKVIEEGRVIDDSRYTVLPNMKSRREVFAAWSKDRIAQLKEQRAKEEKKDPKIRYIAFLGEKATPKLYWPEFKRKFRKEEEMRTPRMTDKEREKLYRDHIARLKLPESKRVEDLKQLLKATPLSTLNRSSTTENLPPTIITDLRYISLPVATRDPLISSYIASLPEAPTPTAQDLSPEEQEAAAAKRAEREKREKALAERERRVQEEKERQRWEQRSGRQMLQHEERELDRAMRVEKAGIMDYIQEEDRKKEEQEKEGST